MEFNREIEWRLGALEANEGEVYEEGADVDMDVNRRHISGCM
jgi:hypothetical protein